MEGTTVFTVGRFFTDFLLDAPATIELVLRFPILSR